MGGDHGLDQRRSIVHLISFQALPLFRFKRTRMSKLIHIADPLGSRVAIGFDTPIAMLKACHRKVHDQCETLQRLVPHLSAHGSDQAAAEAATAVVRYFDIAAPKHHADEEEDLLPALFEAVAGSDAVCLRDMAEALHADHDALNQQWAALRPLLCQVMAGQTVRLDAADVQAFATRYRAHIDFEEAEVLPMAERLLSVEAMDVIGLSMRRRRGSQ